MELFIAQESNAMSKTIIKRRHAAHLNQSGHCCDRLMWFGRPLHFARLHGLAIDQTADRRCRAKYLKSVAMEVRTTRKTSPLPAIAAIITAIITGARYRQGATDSTPRWSVPPLDNRSTTMRQASPMIGNECYRAYLGSSSSNLRSTTASLCTSSLAAYTSVSAFCLAMA